MGPKEKPAAVQDGRGRHDAGLHNKKTEATFARCLCFPPVLSPGYCDNNAGVTDNTVPVGHPADREDLEPPF